MFEFLISHFVLEFLPWLISGLILVLFLGLQIGAKFSEKISPLFSIRFIGFGVLALLAVRLVKTGLEFYGQYYIWLAGESSRYLLPPHNPISYFLDYGWQRFLKDDVFTIAVAAGLFLAVIMLNRIFRERFFYKEEPYLAALGVMAVGWPNWILFLGLVLVPGVLFHLGRLAYQFVIAKGLLRDCFGRLRRSRPAPLVFRQGSGASNDTPLSLRGANEMSDEAISESEESSFRLSFLYFWLPAALAVFLFGAKLAEIAGLGQFRI